MKCSGFLFLIPEMKYTKKGQSAVLIPLLKRSRKKGYILYLRMEKYMHNHFLFLYDPRVPSTNNEAERLLRSYKRKQQAVSFRNTESIRYLCESMSMLIKICQEHDNVFEKVSQIFA